MGSVLKLAKNTAWNLIGQSAPMLIAVFAIPWLITGLGVERFGVLTLAWMVLGYFSIFDFGLGRTLILLVSEKLGADRLKEIPSLTCTALLLMLGLGVLGGSVMWGLSSWLARDVLAIPLDLVGETITTFRLLAISVPLVILTTGLRGILEAYQRFDLVNLARVPLNIMTIVIPLCVLPFSKQLDSIVFFLLLVRIIFVILNVVLVRIVNHELVKKLLWDKKYLRQMLGFGGWMTVTNLVGPIMIYLDRFVIGSVLGMAAVAYYVTPWELVTKLVVIPTAIVGVLFPMFSSSMTTDPGRAAQLFWTGVRWIFVGLFPPTLLLCVFSEEGLSMWLSVQFAGNSAAVLKWLTIGMLINSIAAVPFGFIQAAGRPDLTAKLHLLELIPYLGLLWFGVGQFGLQGVALVWSVRIVFDAVALFLLAAWLNVELKWNLKWILHLALGLMVLACGSLINSFTIRFAYSIIALFLFSVIVWRYIIISSERDFIRRRMEIFMHIFNKRFE
jgi:O-antigen/teichoic acid export membrane protein